MAQNSSLRDRPEMSTLLDLGLVKLTTSSLLDFTVLFSAAYALKRGTQSNTPFSLDF